VVRRDLMSTCATAASLVSSGTPIRTFIPLSMRSKISPGSPEQRLAGADVVGERRVGEPDALRQVRGLK
jgi:hypothetical protein